MISFVRTVFSALLLISFFGVAAASFDCSKAHSKNEKIICSDSQLSSLDEALNKAYGHAYEIAPDKSLLRQTQRDWLGSYAVSSCNDATCLKTLFADRLALLNEVAAAGEPTSKWNGTYVRYWKGKVDKDTATISIIGLRTGRLYVSGSSLWYGPQAKIGQVNDGQMDGYTNRVVAGNSARFDNDGCSANLLLRGNLVEVQGETGCGGLNVTFDGTYQRK
jgi:uncharacterized protein